MLLKKPRSICCCCDPILLSTLAPQNESPLALRAHSPLQAHTGVVQPPAELGTPAPEHLCPGAKDGGCQECARVQRPIVQHHNTFQKETRDSATPVAEVLEGICLDAHVQPLRQPLDLEAQALRLQSGTKFKSPSVKGLPSTATSKVHSQHCVGKLTFHSLALRTGMCCLWLPVSAISPVSMRSARERADAAASPLEASYCTFAGQLPTLRHPRASSGGPPGKLSFVGQPSSANPVAITPVCWHRLVKHACQVLLTDAGQRLRPHNYMPG